MKVVELMEKALKLIDTPEKWTVCYGARDEKDYNIDVLAEGAVCFCTAGALQRAFGKDLTYNPSESACYYEAMQCLSEAEYSKSICSKMPEPPNGDVVSVYVFNTNDVSTHGQVMLWWKEAIELAKSREESTVVTQ